MRELRTPSRTVITQEQNKLFVQKVVQCSQDSEGEVLHYDVLFSDESSTEDDFGKILS